MSIRKRNSISLVSAIRQAGKAFVRRARSMAKLAAVEPAGNGAPKKASKRLVKAGRKLVRANHARKTKNARHPKGARRQTGRAKARH